LLIAKLVGLQAEREVEILLEGGLLSKLFGA